MAAKTEKANTKKKSASQKKTTKSDTKQNKGSASKSKQSVHKKNEVQDESSSVQLAAIFIMVVAVLMLAVVIIGGSAGSVWNALRGVVFGFFGFSAFIIPFVLGYVAVVISKNTVPNRLVIKIFEGLLFVGLLSSVVYIHSHFGKISFIDDISDEFMKYFNSQGFGCGLFGALFGEIFLCVGNSKGPAYAISVVLTIASFMVFCGLTIVRIARGIDKSVKTISNEAKDEITRLREEREEREELEEQDDRIRRKRRFKMFDESVFDDDDEDLLDEDDYRVEKKKKKKSKNYEINSDEASSQKQIPVSENGEIADIFNIPIPFTEHDAPVIPAVSFDVSAKEEKIDKKEIESKKEEVAAQVEESKNPEDDSNYKLPPLSILREPVKNVRAASQADLKATAEKLIAALKSFNVDASISEIVPGPSVTRYEVVPAPGVKISKFTGLADDLALHLAAPAGIRIEAPIPNKSAIGIEVPNRGRATVTMREIVDSDVYRKGKSKLNVALGKDIAGNVVCCDITKMPHLLVAGTTGSGKSVCLNSMIVSVLYNAKPSEVKILLIDPKQVEFSVYNGIPHLLVPVVSDARKAAGALNWAVTEMTNRYKTLSENGVRDIGAYNSLCEERDDLEKMPHIMIVVDELSDLMSVAPSEVEDSITRLAQMARAAGMHLVVATQRPSVDVITGLIKANIPSRIALSVSSQVDSRTIIDSAGAEKLLGLGDMLYYPVGMSKPQRVQGCYLSDSEREAVVDYIKSQEMSAYSDEIQSEIDKNALSTAPKKGAAKDTEQAPEGGISDVVMKAAELVIKNPEKASISAFQRNLSLGFSKAGRTMDELEALGVVGPSAGSKPRKVLMTLAQWYEMNALNDSDADPDSDSEVRDYE